MKQLLKNYAKNICLSVPDCLWSGIEKILSRRYCAEAIESLRMLRFAKRLYLHLEDTVEELQKNRKCMIISCGTFSYTCFNIAYLCNMLALIFQALYHGCVPVISINDTSVNDNKWDWYFIQPHEVLGIDISKFDVIDCGILNHIFRPKMEQVHHRNEFEWKFWKFMVAKFAALNNQTQQYVDEEMKAIGQPNKMLGILIRGTDYIKLKPRWHPVQPEPQEIIFEAKKRFGSNYFEGVYVATEEQALYDQMVSAFGENKVYQNRRKYYDDVFYTAQLREIGQVHFPRENDNYWKGLEYLSSLMILSQCKSLVAGNCGGTLFAMLKGNYRNPYIFDKGFY